MNDNHELGTKAMTGAEMALRSVATRMRTGAKLTQAEENMAMVAAAAVKAESFGPKPGDMTVPSMDLPESVKGILAQYSS